MLTVEKILEGKRKILFAKMPETFFERSSITPEEKNKQEMSRPGKTEQDFALV